MKRALIVQTAYLGDVILSQPLWAALKRERPDVEIDVLVQPHWAELIRPDVAINNVLTFDKRGGEGSLRGMLHLTKSLQARQYDAALCPHPSFRSALLLVMARIPQRIGFDDSSGKFFFTQRVRRDPAEHEVDRVLSLLTALGLRTADDQRQPRLHLADDLHNDADEKMRGWGIDPDKRIVCVHPGSVWATKRWLPERFAAVISELADDGLQAVVLGGRDDIEAANIVQDRARTMPVNLAGKLSLTELALILSRAALLVTNDSGPMHIAGAVGTPVVAVFGSTTPELGYAPYGENTRVVQANLPCRPCGPHGYKRCPLDHFNCMKQITAVEVTAACRELLA